MSVENRDLRGYVTQAGFDQENQDKQFSRATELTHILIDGDLLPDDQHPGQLTAMPNEVRRYPVGRVEAKSEGGLVVEAVIPADDGGFTINGLGVETSRGVLYGYARSTGDYKPLLAAGAGSDLVLRFHLVPANADQIQISIDPSSVLATVAQLDSAMAAHEEVEDPHSQYLKKSEFKPRVLGEPFWHFGETPPVGALLFAGQLLNRSDYPELWAALNDSDRNITFVSEADYVAGRRGYWSLGDGVATFRVPDPRGLVLRVWDAGLGVDPGRVAGTTQDDAIRNITGHLSSETGNESLFLDEPNNISGSGALSASVAQTGLSGGTSIANGGTGRFEFDASKVVPTADENRMKNISWPLAFWYE